MARVHQLDPRTIAQIRAGEVIDRPGSIVKELVENAIDAGATSIHVQILAGGVEEIIVHDDGHGMSADDALLAVERHTTSKISHSDDLFCLTSLGFRGEALASIAAVSHLELVSRDAHSTAGVRVRVAGSGRPEAAPSAAARGTTLTVRNLFYNTPARRAFLRSPTAEGKFVEEVLVGLALSRPGITFGFRRDGRDVFNTPAAGGLAVRAAHVLGRPWVDGLLPVAEVDAPRVEDGIGVAGLIGRPDHHKRTRAGQYFFVNGRLVKSRPLSFAFSRGFGELLEPGRFPLGLLFVSVPQAHLDVNVHPTKREVKFRDERDVLRVVVRCVRQVLDRANLFKSIAAPLPDGSSIARDPSVPLADPADYPAWRSSDRVRSPGGLRVVPKPISDPPSVSEGIPSQAQAALWRRPTADGFRVLGQSHQLFVLVEVEAELWIVDQHAAHERVMYEQTLARLRASQGESQRLLIPFTLDLPPAARAAFEEVQDQLAVLGFDVQPFGGSTYHVQAAPPYFRPADIPDLMVELAEARAEGRPDDSLDAKQRDLAARVACKVKSVKAGQTLSPQAMTGLVTSLLDCQSPFVCPHGRPTMVRLAVGQLERQFDRR